MTQLNQADQSDVDRARETLAAAKTWSAESIRSYLMPAGVVRDNSDLGTIYAAMCGRMTSDMTDLLNLIDRLVNGDSLPPSHAIQDAYSNGWRDGQAAALRAGGQAEHSDASGVFLANGDYPGGR